MLLKRRRHKKKQVCEFSCSTVYLEKSHADGFQDNGIHRGMKRVSLMQSLRAPLLLMCSTEIRPSWYALSFVSCFLRTVELKVALMIDTAAACALRRSSRRVTAVVSLALKLL
jgi:hypothetical protein